MKYKKNTLKPKIALQASYPQACLTLTIDIWLQTDKVKSFQLII